MRRCNRSETGSGQVTISREQIEQALALTGWDDWQPAEDVPGLERPRQRPPDLPGQGRTAAVLVLIYPGPEQQLQLVLTGRPQHLSRHAGQISFPGGRQDPGESILQTALRETREELGVEPGGLQVLGSLNTIYIPPSDYTVHPLVAWREETPHFEPSPDEVSEVIQVSLDHLLRRSTYRRGKVQVRPQVRWTVPYFAIARHQVWGATALILSELVERLRYVHGEREGGGTDSRSR